MSSANRTMRLTRRRFIAISAAAGTASALPRSAYCEALQDFTWRGVALGATASLTLQHHNEVVAKAAIGACLAEVARLDGIFNLHRPDSAVARLNATGSLDDAPADLRMLLAEAMALAERSGGAFDPTIQPLWMLYARHFGSPDSDPDGPNEPDIAKALRLVGWRKVAVDDARIRFREPGMSITLNGIAQGYITDKVGDLLRARGFEHVLVNMGEQLALGPRWDGDAWHVGIADPVDPGRLIEKVPLSSGAIATSGGYGCRFDEAGRFTHILDPCTGLPAQSWASVTVLGDRATLVDGLSTALAVAPASASPGLLTGTVRAYTIPFGGGPGNWI